MNIDIHDERNDEHRLIIQSGMESQYTSKMGFDLYGIKISVSLNATKEFIARQFEERYNILKEQYLEAK